MREKFKFLKYGVDGVAGEGGGIGGGGGYFFYPGKKLSHAALAAIHERFLQVYRQMNVTPVRLEGSYERPPPPPPPEKRTARCGCDGPRVEG